MKTKLSASVLIAFIAVGSAAILTAQTTKPVAQAATRAQTPSEVAARFFAAVRVGDADAAIQHIARFPDVPPQLMEELRKDLSEPWRTQPVVIGYLQHGTAAVVIVNDSAPDKERVDLDPAYLIQQNGSWYLCPQIASFKSRWFTLDEPTTSSLEKLKAWFKSQKATIAKMHTGM
jgi:hypothetical protein